MHARVANRLIHGSALRNNYSRLIPASAAAAGVSRAGPRRFSSAPASADGSQYEDYETTSQTYDIWRRPISVDTYKETLIEVGNRVGKDVSELSLLEAGCGTANYSHLFSSVVGQVVGLEYSEGMLSQAREKCAGIDNITLMQGNICAMKALENNSMDAAMVNQVLHHLYSETDGFAATQEAVRELSRVVKPGGAVIIQTQTPQQHRLGFWWADVVPAAAR